MKNNYNALATKAMKAGTALIKKHGIGVILTQAYIDTQAERRHYSALAEAAAKAEAAAATQGPACYDFSYLFT